jgi:hypothetical protein
MFCGSLRGHNGRGLRRRSGGVLERDNQEIAAGLEDSSEQLEQLVAEANSQPSSVRFSLHHLGESGLVKDRSSVGCLLAVAHRSIEQI